MKAKNRDREYDMGGGFWVEVRHHGAQVWYDAVQLDEPGGYIVNKRKATFSYRRDADAQVAAWRQEDGARLRASPLDGYDMNSI